MCRPELARILDQLANEQGLSGTLLVAQRGEVLVEKAYGWASRQLTVPNVLATRFPIASVSKMFIALAALILVEQGHLELQEPPAVYLPELAALDPAITLHHLLSHTSGLQDIYEVPHLEFALSKLQHEQGTLLSYLAQQPQLYPPGERWSYSSTGYLLMDYVMEHVTGLAFSELMQRYVLAPLAMTNTGLDWVRRINVGRAAGHRWDQGQWLNAENDALSGFEAPWELYSTVHDLKKWCDAMFACPLVSPATLQLLFTPYGQVDPGMQYGYGWFLAPRFRMHGGGLPGFQAGIRQYPEQQVSIILLLNTDHLRMETLFQAVEPLIAG